MIARDFSWRGHSLKVRNKGMNTGQHRASHRAANHCLVDLWCQFALLLSTPCVDLDALTFLLLPLTNQHESNEIVNITIAPWHRVLNPLIWASQPQERPTKRWHANTVSYCCSISLYLEIAQVRCAVEVWLYTSCSSAKVVHS